MFRKMEQGLRKGLHMHTYVCMHAMSVCITRMYVFYGIVTHAEYIHTYVRYSNMRMTIHFAGNALLTVATGELGGEAERAGLVPTHAYAILNVVEIKVNSSYSHCV